MSLFRDNQQILITVMNSISKTFIKRISTNLKKKYQAGIKLLIKI